VIVREGVRGRVRPGLTPLLTAALADPHGGTSARRLIDHAAAPPPSAPTSAFPSAPTSAPQPPPGPVPPPGRRAAGPDDHALAWWDAYVRRLVPPVLHVFREHGVVLEPHLQNVVMAVDADGMPAQAIFRDLEGTKLVGDRHARTLAALPARVGAALAYDAERGWNRVVYCLFVNHLAEIAATIATSDPRLEDRLWQLARHRLLAYARRYGTDGRLRGLLAGVPLPAKTNLLTRWARAADRRAGSIPVPNPLGGR
jgi:siderophore synthetase component